MSKDKKEPERAPLPASRLEAIVDAYGADSTRWPTSERALVLALLETDPSLRGMVTTQAALDEILAAMRPVAISETLAARILADFDRHASARNTVLTRRIVSAVEKLGQALWPGAPLWQPLSAVALSLILRLPSGPLFRPSCNQ